MRRNQGRLLLALSLVLGIPPAIHSQGSEQFTARKAVQARSPGGPDNDVRTARSEPPIQVSLWDQTWNGWSVSDTGNFRVFHLEAPDLAEKVARIAERTRTAVLRRWFGQDDERWNDRCEICLYPTAEQYSAATGAPPVSPGHSSFRVDGGRVLHRRIDLRCDDPRLLAAVLPHETTHAVLAGMFGDRQVPRWVDEGVAVLSEPRAMIDRHLASLRRFQQDGVLFSSREVMEASDYPDPGAVAVFYAQSVSLVDFLTRVKGPRTFVRFVRDGLGQGFEQSLARHYGWGFDDLQDHWERYAFAQPDKNPDVAHASMH